MTSSRGTGVASRWPVVPLGVVAVSTVLYLFAAFLWWLPVTQASTGRAGSTTMPWWVVAVVVFACEMVVVHTQLRREAHAVSLSELATVLGVFFATPGQFVVGRAIGSFMIFAIWRRQTFAKLVFNMALYLAESMVMLAVFHAVRGAGRGVDPRAWAAAGVASVSAGAFACVAVSLVIAMLEREIHVKDLAGEMTTGAITSLAVTMAALVAVHALEVNPIAGVPIALVVVMLMFAYRAYSRLSERYLSLERLVRFSHAVSSSPEVDEILVDLLNHARTVLRAEYAEVVFLAPDHGTPPLRVDTDATGGLRRGRLSPEEAAEPLWSGVLDSGVPLLVQSGRQEPELEAFLAARGLRDAVLAAVQGETGTVGTILVGDRLREVRTFDADDVHLLTTVANQAGIALRNGQLAERLRHEALHDPLTGLPNRTQLSRVLSEVLSPPRSAGPPAATIMIIDLVGFKHINETLGMQLGDMVLAEVGTRMAEVIEGQGTLARLGGDEFAVVLPGVRDLAAAMPVVQALQQAAQSPVQIEDIAVEVGAWIGISMAPADGLEAAVLLQRADAAMSEAKLSGSGWHVYDAEMHDSGSRKRLALVAELRHGIAEDELEVYVQPQGDLRTGRIASVEALVRWRHPRRGLLFPDEFIPLAERNGLIRPLTSAVLECAVSEAGRWRHAGLDVSISVNLSARSSITDETVEEVSELLTRYDLPPPALVLELTEGSVIRDPARTRAVLERLNALGVRLSVDDFGTGYSSLSYLRELPVHEVKIDKSFVMTMLSNSQDEMIVRSIIDLARNLGLAVVAEGVEDSATWQALETMGCDVVQGYYLARPMPIADFPVWLKSQEQRGLMRPVRTARPTGVEGRAGG
jgi:diguanylate cyclase (GGDEF)-like protein